METYGEYITRPSTGYCELCGVDVFQWTDFNNEARCAGCGNLVYVAQFRVAQNAVRYMVQPKDVKPVKMPPAEWMCREANKAYLEETGRKLPLGHYFIAATSPYNEEDVKHYLNWIYEHRNEYPGIYDAYDIDRIGEVLL